MKRTHMKRTAALALATTAVLGLGACGDDDGGDLARWCQLGEEINAALESGDAITDDTFDEFADAAPEDIQDASGRAVDAFKESAEAIDDPAVQDAVGEIEAYNESQC
jgi:hypothetical protein